MHQLKGLYGNRSLIAKLTILFLLIGLVPVSAVGMWVSHRAGANLEGAAFSELGTYAGLTERALEDYFDGIQAETNIISNTRDIYHSLSILSGLDWDQSDELWRERVGVIDALVSAIVEEEGYPLIFITDPDARIVYSSDEEILGADLTDREYVSGALEGRTTWSELFYSNVTETNALAVSSPIRSEGRTGEILGTLNITVFDAGMADAVHMGLAELGQSGDAYLIDGDGTLLTNTRLGEYTSDSALQVSLDTRAVELLAPAIQEGNFDFDAQEIYPDYLGNQVLGALEVLSIGDNPVGLVVEIDRDEALAGADDLRNVILMSIVVAALIVVALGILQARSVATPIVRVADELGEIATGEGDLTTELPVLTGDELGRLSENFNAFVGTMRTLIADIIDSAEQVANTAEGMESNAQQVSEASHGIARAMEQVASGAARQSTSVDEASQVVEQLRTAIDQISTGAQDQSVRAQEMLNVVEGMVSSIDGVAENAVASLESSRSAGETADEGSTIIKEMVDCIENIRDTAVDAASHINELGHSSDKIGDITAVITDIAQQTNLLALNAAIEAARADQGSSGFAVVADEVRKLAERAGESAKEISGLIATIQDGTTQAVEAMDKGSEATQDGVSRADDAADALRQILTVVDEVTAKVEEMSEGASGISEASKRMAESVESVAAITEENTAATEEMAAGAEQMASSIEAVQAVSQDNASASEEVAASVEELNASLSEVTESSQNLADVARNLRQKVAMFKV